MAQNFAFNDLFKNTLDFSQLASASRRNIETASAINQAMVESCQTVSRAGAEAIRSNVETVLKNSKDIFTGGSPETSMARQADLAKSIFENTLANLREMSEVVTKSSFEMFDVINQRCAESLEEISKASTNASKRKNAA